MVNYVQQVADLVTIVIEQWGIVIMVCYEATELSECIIYKS